MHLAIQLFPTKMVRASQADKEKQAVRQDPTNGQSGRIWPAHTLRSEADLAGRLLLIGPDKNETDVRVQQALPSK